VLTIVDDFTRGSVDVVADFGISGHLVSLDQADCFCGLSDAIRADQRPEFTGKAFDQWAHRKGVKLKLIQSDKPTPSAYIESVNKWFRDECLNDRWFTSLGHARTLIAAWRQDYNEGRPHSALNYLAPLEFAARHPANDPTMIQKKESIK
jgi:putative transposase